MKSNKIFSIKKLSTVLMAIVLPSLAFSNTTDSQLPYFMGNALFWVMLSAILLLLVVIVILAETAKNIASTGMKNKTKATKATVLLSLIGFASTTDVFAQVENAASTSYIGGLESGMFYAMLTLIILELAVIFFLIHSIQSLLKGLGYTKEDESKVPFLSYEYFQTFYKSMTKVVPIEEEAEVMTDHEYDGIRELDNQLPPWWVYMFYLTIVFSVVYMLHYHVLGTGPSSNEEYLAQLHEGEVQRENYLKIASALVDETNATLLTSTADLQAGKDVFIMYCAACHGQLGEGGVGPNLTDKYWLNGGDIKNVFKSVKYGFPQKGMIAWQTMIKPNEIQQVSSYVLSLQGTNPPNAKAAEGTIYNEQMESSTENESDNLETNSEEESNENSAALDSADL